MKKSLFIIALSLFCFIPFGIYSQELAPGTDIIGYGYNVFGKFADNSSKKPYPIFQFGYDKTIRIGTKEYIVPNGIMLDNIGQKEQTVVSGSNQREYAKSFGVSAGVDIDALTFGASVSASFDNSWGGSVQQHYYTLRDANRLWRVGIDQRIEPTSIMSAQAKSDINKMDPSRLLELYGTHVIVSAYLGGRADYTIVTKITESFSETAISAAASASYGVVTGKVSVDNKSSKSSLSSNSKTSLIVTGGNAEFANNIHDYEAYSRWAEGIRTMPVLCDFDESSLIPIWELAATQSRRNEIMNAFNQLASQYPLPEAFAGLGLGMANESFYVKSKSSGLYWDLPGFHFDAKTLGGRLSLAEKDLNGDNVQGADRFFKLIPHQNDPEYVFFQPQHAKEVVDVKYASTEVGGILHLEYQGLNNRAQMFKMIEADDGEENTYLIQNANSGLLLTESNGEITQQIESGWNDQIWVFEKARAAEMAPPPAFRTYRLRSVVSDQVWDVQNAGGQGSRVQLHEVNGNHAQAFYMTPYHFNAYMFRPMHNRDVALDLHPENDSILGVYGINYSGAQKFSFEWAGSPRVYRILQTDSPGYITADRNYINSRGCNLYAWDKAEKGELQNWIVELCPPLGNAASDKAWTSGRWGLGTRVLHSANLKFSLVFQNDGNLVIYADGNNAIWSSGTYNTGAREFVYQNDGNLVIYGDAGRAIWASSSNGSGAEALMLQDDGTLVLHAPGVRVVWASK
jgi:hypothetical protein